MKPYYERGGVTIYVGDAREVIALFPADVLITDPDYGVGMVYGDQRLKGSEADSLLKDVLTSIQISSGHGCVFWSGSWERIRTLETTLEGTGWNIRHLGIWYKPNGAGASGNGLARRFEPWFWLDKGIGKKRGEWSRLPDCISINRVHRGMAEASAHPSQKPEELMRRLIRFFSRPGDLVLDPFMGSGTTLRAAKDLGRRAIGIELNEAYAEIAVRRLEQEVLALDTFVMDSHREVTTP